MTASRGSVRPWHLVAALAVANLSLCGLLLYRSLSADGTDVPGIYDVDRMVLIHATLPRLAMALLCGFALAVSGAILQQALRNPLASPTTLGVDAGARLALAVTGAFFPAVFGFGRDLVAIAGSMSALSLVFFLSRAKSYSSLNIILSGLVIGLFAGAVAVIITLAKDRYLVGLFVWGSGSLSQTSWQPFLALAPRIGLSLLPLVLLWRALDVLDIGDEGSRSVGVSVTYLRVSAVAVAVFLSAFVTASVGVIGFIGLCAPLIARLCGARRFRDRIVWAGLIGAMLLLLTDAALQLFGGRSTAFLPTGAVTALLGAPLLLLLLPNLRFPVPPPTIAHTKHRKSRLSPKVWGLIVTGAALLLALSLVLGRGPEGSWFILGPDTFDPIWPWRVPRWGAACVAGAMLGVAGFILQRLTGNPMASPEILGISAGVILAVAASVFFFGALGTGYIYLTGTLGGLAVLALILALSRRSGFAPERILLAGIAMTALIDAAVGLLSATGDPNAVRLLSWLAGSTSGTSLTEASYALAAAVVLIAPAFLMARWLTILPLGPGQATALGIPTKRARLILLILAALLTTAATPIIGPLTFVGLMAPIIVSALGITGAATALGANAVAGALLMAIADTTARTVAFPILLPTGVTAALVACPLLLFLLQRRSIAT